MKKLIISFLTVISLLAGGLFPAAVSAQSTADVCNGVGAASGGSGCTPTGGVTDINKVVQTGLRIFQVIVGIIAFVMMLVAGLRFITSSGDSAKVSNARNTIIYAMVGVVVIVLAQVIIQFVLNRTV